MIIHLKVGFIPEIQGLYNIYMSINIIINYKNGLKDQNQNKKTHGHVNRSEKAFNKIQHVFRIKVLANIELEET